MDFTQMPVSQGYKYLLVTIDTFTGWIEGFPTQTEKAKEVVKKKLLHEIIPRFGLPRSLQSDNGTSFTSKVTQGVSKVSGITQITGIISTELSALPLYHISSCFHPENSCLKILIWILSSFFPFVSPSRNLGD